MGALVPLLLVGVLSWLGTVSCAPQSAEDHWEETTWGYLTTRPRPVGIPADRLTTIPTVVKGEYICGDNKVCKLEPGVEPEGCNGMCQYPLGGPSDLSPPVTPKHSTEEEAEDEEDSSSSSSSYNKSE